MQYENSLREIISNHLTKEELASFNLNEINFSYGLEFYSPITNISNIILASWEGSLKPRENEVVKIMSEKSILKTLSNVHDQSYSIYKSGDDSFYIVIGFSWS